MESFFLFDTEKNNLDIHAWAFARNFVKECKTLLKLVINVFGVNMVSVDLRKNDL